MPAADAPLPCPFAAEKMHHIVIQLRPAALSAALDSGSVIR